MTTRTRDVNLRPRKGSPKPKPFGRLEEDYAFEVLDRQNHDLFKVQIAGTSRRIDDFLEAVGRDKIVEVARSGFTALEK